MKKLHSLRLRFKKPLKRKGRRSWIDINMMFNTIKESTTRQSRTGSATRQHWNYPADMDLTVMLKSLTDSASIM